MWRSIGNKKSVWRKKDEDETTMTTAIAITLNFLQVIEERRETQREKESAYVCSNGDGN